MERFDNTQTSAIGILDRAVMRPWGHYFEFEGELREPRTSVFWEYLRMDLVKRIADLELKKADIISELNEHSTEGADAAEVKAILESQVKGATKYLIKFQGQLEELGA
ncbi:hypothetical protein CVT24_000106 [Panaeolus cyanescens]|uniref:Uncharacterized protein n=1 Tax=Panaeolus cyanescens TaxID=181874 RepID=A0A409W7Q7_9AGAR|nr:hypothetical protein CVT24_000106 [Panaeolus cyanescens]